MRQNPYGELKMNELDVYASIWINSVDYRLKHLQTFTNHTCSQTPGAHVCVHACVTLYVLKIWKCGLQMLC